MANKMLIDSSHPEETRVVVVRGSRIEEFDFESQDKKQLKGNIYLARVTRVEPSLQAAFVDYGGNRHGFLAFNEIHPDYYQIPVADRQALLRADAEAEAAEDDNGDAEKKSERPGKRRRGVARDKRGDRQRGSRKAEAGSADAAPTADAEATGPAFEEPSVDEGSDVEGGPDVMLAAIESESVSERAPDGGGDEDSGVYEVTGGADEQDVESVGAEDALEELPDRRRFMRRQYKIQEVIKRRQILLVQVVKEERGNKGAALTTYLSLAGRYSVLMPNTPRGGGISRKITNAQDRKRLKEVVHELEVPQGMGVILRTAGANRTKAEIKRDYEYLMRLWENVRTLTLQSTAPALVYEEGSLIKRSVRDLYNKDIDEILVAGEDGYREAKDFMRMLMPSHAKAVQPYRDSAPIFARNGIEAQLDKMLQPQVTLKSGGYIIINQTEALVSIDVNSGRSTREHSIEDTALQTNLEAAEEVARQLRLRDLAGLIVIDFIDMEEKRNNRSVEKRLKDHLKNDRARIQVGRISHFGLLEMSRQRIRASVLESTMQTCPHCGGTGHVRSDSSTALHVLRAIEDHLLKDPRHHLIVRTSMATALYMLNHKRASLLDLERRFALTIMIEADAALAGANYAIQRGAIVDRPAGAEIPALTQVAALPEPEDDPEIEESADEEEKPVNGAASAAQAEDGTRKRRRKRRRRGGRGRDGQDRADAASGDSTEGVDDADNGQADEDDADIPAATEAEAAPSGDGEPTDDQAGEDGQPRKRRRGKRGGARRKREAGEASAGADADEEPASETISEPVAETTPEPAVPAAEAAPAPDVPEVVEEDAPAATKPARRRSARTVPAATAEPVVTSAKPESTAEEAPRKGGWWQRKSFF